MEHKAKRCVSRRYHVSEKTKILQEAEHYCKLGKDQDGFQLKFIDTIIGRPAYNRFCIPFNRLFCRDLTVLFTLIIVILDFVFLSTVYFVVT